MSSKNYKKSKNRRAKLVRNTRLTRPTQHDLEKSRSTDLSGSNSMGSSGDLIIVNIPTYQIKTEEKQINLPFSSKPKTLTSKYILFTLELRNVNNYVWKIDRSFNSFRYLDKKIKWKFPQLKKILPKFPKRQLSDISPRLLNITLGGNQNDALDFRLKFFQTYLQALLQFKPRIKYVNDFIELSKHLKKKREKEKVDLGDFELCTVLGEGNFGKVFLVRIVSTSDLFAMKVLRKSEIKKKEQVKNTKTELRVMGSLTHVFIVKLRYAFNNEKNLFLVSDYCEGGELFHHLQEHGNFPEDVVRFYSGEILLALNYLHENKIIYRDLKPENILLDGNSHIKLTDFGLSRDNMNDPETGATSFVGTPEYLAPELIKNQKLKQGYGFAADYWAFGVMFYEMLFGLPPFYEENRKLMLKKILFGRITFSKSVPISPATKSLIMKFLERKPGKRIGFEKTVKHEFFKTLDFGKLEKLELDPPDLLKKKRRRREHLGSFVKNKSNNSFTLLRLSLEDEDETEVDHDKESAEKEEDFSDFNFVNQEENFFFSRN